ncbi:ephrin type-B receptor 3-like [Pristis pectinata]|uniref:ephrin type-B receptor 3-like n=1 Tax=Pristis pectinata TaxID=685728 RepID=UPI00223E553B|nr:ephrin type-B receptor 3-like [Pristis pectinata]
MCNVELPNQDWLRSGFIRQGEARLVYVDLRFSVRDCRSFQGAAGFCRETFTLYHRQSDSEGAVSASSTKELRVAYAKVLEVGADHVFTLEGERPGQQGHDAARPAEFLQYFVCCSQFHPRPMTASYTS